MRLTTTPSSLLGVFNNAKRQVTNIKRIWEISQLRTHSENIRGVSVAMSAFAALFVVVIYTGASHAGSPTVVDVSGTLASNTTWTPDNVYVLTGQAEVPNGVTLTIDAGTVVKDTGSYYIKVDSGGTLNGTGSSSSPITFTSVNDNSVGGSTGSGSPAVDDYWDGIEMNGGTVNLSFATFEYAGTGIADVGGDSGSSVTVTDSTFSNEYSGVNLSGAYWTSTLSLERNSFNLNTPSSGSLAVDTNYDSDLSGIVLSGVNENTFTGSGNNVTVGSEGHSNVASGATWEVSTSSGVTKLNANGANSITVNGTMSLDSNLVLVTNGFPAIPVNGTANLASGVVVKSQSNTAAFQVNSGGTLNVTGTSTSHVVFTSINDNSVGGSTGSGSPAAADYSEAVELNDGTLSVAFATFEYANQSVADVGGDSGSSATITDSSFTNDNDGVNLSGASGTTTLSLQRNTFNLSTASTTNYNAVAVTHDGSLSGIVLTGTNENKFTGSGLNIRVMAQGSSDVASGTTWAVDPSSNAVIEGDGANSFSVDGTFDLNTELISNSGSYPSVQINGTTNVGSGVTVKGESGSTAFQVNSGGVLNGSGTVSSLITFTSINDNSVGGTTGNGSPAVADLGRAINVNGGLADVTFASFKYANVAVGDVGGDSGSSVTISDSSFTNDNDGVNLNSTSGGTTLSLQANTFNLGTASTTNDYAVEVYHDTDLSGIVLSGSNKNIFEGSGKNLVVEAGGPSDIPSGSTWTVDSNSGATLSGWGTTPITVEGTVNLDSGVVLKGQSNDNIFEVNSGGTLNGTGTSTNPIYFTSINDNSVGASVGSGSPAAADYATAIELNGGSVDTTYVSFEYANTAINMSTGDANFENTTTNYTDYAVSDTNGNIIYRGTITNSTHGIYACNWQYSCNVDAAYVNWGSTNGPFLGSSTLACGNVTVNPWTYNGTNYTDHNIFAIPACDSSETPSAQMNDRITSYQGEISTLNTDCANNYANSCSYISTYNACIQAAWNVVSSNEGGSFSMPSGSPITDPTGYASAFITSLSDYIDSQEQGTVSGMTFGIAGEVANQVGIITNLNSAYDSCLSTAHQNGY